VKLSPLVRPLVELHWTRMVAQFNSIAVVEQDLQDHLFGSDRVTPPLDLRRGLGFLQGGRCFYCKGELTGTAEADHFVPRSRCNVDAIENLVMADRSCNNDKRDILAGPELIRTWAERNRVEGANLVRIANNSRWDTDATVTLAVARSIYRNLPGRDTPFWLGRGKVDSATPALAVGALQIWIDGFR
jgi:5-methylcytosine-specific restriction endonuclease McrA